MTDAPGVPLRRPTHPAVAPAYHVRIKSFDERQLWEQLAAEIGPELQTCWDHMAHTPTRMLANERCHRLRGAHLRHIWQYKPTTGHNFRIWYVVDEPNHRVLVVAVHAHHP